MSVSGEVQSAAKANAQAYDDIGSLDSTKTMGDSCKKKERERCQQRS